MDTIVVEINENNIQNAAELSTELWPDSSLTEMVAHYEGVLNASLATCFLLQNESGYFGFIELYCVPPSFVHRISETYPSFKRFLSTLMHKT